MPLVRLNVRNIITENYILRGTQRLPNDDDDDDLMLASYKYYQLLQ